LSAPPISLAEALRTAYGLLPPRSRRIASLLVVLMFVNGLVEVSGVAGILPLMSLASDPTVLERSPWLRWVYVEMGWTTPQNFLLFLGCAFMGLYLLVNVSRATTAWLNFRFTYDVSHQLANRLLRSYLSRSYLWLRQRNSAELSKDVLTEMQALAENVYLPMNEICTDGLAALMIGTGLLVLEPGLAIGTGLSLGLMFGLVYQVNRRQLQRNGELRDRINSHRFRAVHEGLYALREARLLGRRDAFLQRYFHLSRRYNNATVTGELIYELPKYLTELLALSALITALLYFSFNGKAAAVAWLGLYVMAIWRMVPALQALYRNLARIRFYAPILQRIAHELSAPLEIGDPVKQPLPLGSGVALRDVTFSYNAEQGPVLCGINLEIRRGQRVALVGETGSGKTTVADIVAGLVTPTGGRLEVDGRPVESQQCAAWQANIGYVPQEIYLSDDSVAANVALGISGDQLDRAALERASRIASIDEFVHELPDGFHTKLGERGAALSGGQRQRIGIARALYHGPELLILDEATSALDEVTQRRVLEGLDAGGADLTVLVIAHRLEVVRSCDRIYLLAGGKVAASGTYEELLGSSPEFQELAGRGRTHGQ
jgi:ATP-binding cassette, subfamily B, bacterial PglK